MNDARGIAASLEVGLRVQLRASNVAHVRVLDAFFLDHELHDAVAVLGDVDVPGDVVDVHAPIGELRRRQHRLGQLVALSRHEVPGVVVEGAELVHQVVGLARRLRQLRRVLCGLGAGTRVRQLRGGLVHHDGDLTLQEELALVLGAVLDQVDVARADLVLRRVLLPVRDDVLAHHPPRQGVVRAARAHLVDLQRLLLLPQRREARRDGAAVGLPAAQVCEVLLARQGGTRLLQVALRQRQQGGGAGGRRSGGGGGGGGGRSVGGGGQRRRLAGRVGLRLACDLRARKQHALHDEVDGDDVRLAVLVRVHFLHEAEAAGDEEGARGTEGVHPAGERLGERAADDGGTDNGHGDRPPVELDQVLRDVLRHRVRVREAVALEHLWRLALERARLRVQDLLRHGLGVEGERVQLLLDHAAVAPVVRVARRDVDEGLEVAALVRLAAQRQDLQGAQHVEDDAHTQLLVEVDGRGKVEDHCDVLHKHAVVRLAHAQVVVRQAALHGHDLLAPHLHEVLLAVLLLHARHDGALQELLLEALCRVDTLLRTHHEVHLRHLRQRPQDLLQEDLADEAGHAGDEDVLSGVCFFHLALFSSFFPLLYVCCVCLCLAGDTKRTCLE
eukprot:Rhum_TRINITY_DN12411_c0_g1::Rhum_TRINITY_DN12411_c0_g1_i1::g.51791::m.51791